MLQKWMTHDHESVSHPVVACRGSATNAWYFLLLKLLPRVAPESLPFIVVFAHPSSVRSDPAVVLVSPSRSWELARLGSWHGGPYGGAPAPPRPRPCALFWSLVCCALYPVCDQIRQECLSGPPALFSIHISLTDLEIQQVDPVAELDIFWFGHFSCPPEDLCLADLPAGCRHLLPRLVVLGRGLLKVAIEISLSYWYGSVCSSTT